MLNRLSSAANAAPIVASCAFCASVEVPERDAGTPISRPPNTSWIIGDAMPITPIPALTLRHSTPHSSQNCGVFHAWSTCTCRVVIIARARIAACSVVSARCVGTRGATVQSGGGIR